VACPAVLSVATLNAADLTESGPVAGDPPSSHFHLDDLKFDQWPGGAFALLQSIVAETPIFAAIMQSAAMGGYGIAIDHSSRGEVIGIPRATDR